MLASVHEHTEFVVDSSRNVQPVKLGIAVRITPAAYCRVGFGGRRCHLSAPVV